MCGDSADLSGASLKPKNKFWGKRRGKAGAGSNDVVIHQFHSSLGSLQFFSFPCVNLYYNDNVITIHYLER